LVFCIHFLKHLMDDKARGACVENEKISFAFVSIDIHYLTSW